MIIFLKTRNDYRTLIANDLMWKGPPSTCLPLCSTLIPLSHYALLAPCHFPDGSLYSASHVVPLCQHMLTTLPPPPPKCCLLFLTTFFTIPFGPTLSWAPEVKLIWCQIKLDFSFYLVGRGDFSWSLYAGFEIFVKSSTSRNMFVISFVKLLHCQSKTLLYVVIYHLNMLHTFWLTRHVILNGSDILLVYNKSFDWCLYKRNAVPATHNVSACNNSYNL